MTKRTQQELATIVGNNIAMIRRRQGLSQKEFAEMMDIGADSLSRIERGFVAPRFGRLEKLAKALGCSVATFFESGDNMPRPEIAMSRDEEILMLIERIREILTEEPQSSNGDTRKVRRPRKTRYAIRAQRKFNLSA